MGCLVMSSLCRLDESRTFQASPSQPYYVRYRMPDGIDSILVQTQAYDTKCLVMSLQPIGVGHNYMPLLYTKIPNGRLIFKCPVFDLDNNINFVGTYQTITTKGAIPVDVSLLFKMNPGTLTEV